MRMIAQVSLRCIRDGFLSSGRFQAPHLIKSLSTNAPSDNWIGDNQSSNSFESADGFEQRIFGGIDGGNSPSESFFQKLDRLAKARNGPGSRLNERNSSEMVNDLDSSFNTLKDGMDEKLQEAAGYIDVDIDDIDEYRPDAHFEDGDTYDIKDLDLTKPFVRRERRDEFCVTTAEVLSKADFRNVRFLANFITDAGIIIKRRQTGISAKAQRKVAREIKTARAFGLMPFTTMGTKSFVFGTSMQSQDEDFQYRSYDHTVDDEKDHDEA
ncbi:hypothetical protein NC653_016919 [Populus alba x Populus x berolinensis]|uniref:Small ribosomal subunit protein bS18c n=1 Tax=Populus alba x Populus x berolinensis TaxID=444605 RepID=A0AAD6QP57_9ROSI|nr:hypothetical protein NC653_016919 [Populus alba x Populus x berolinensis]